MFYELCEKYDVELSEQYGKPMIRIDNEVKEITSEDVKNIVPRFQHYFFYDSLCITGKMAETASYMPDELLIAC